MRVQHFCDFVVLSCDMNKMWLLLRLLMYEAIYCTFVSEILKNYSLVVQGGNNSHCIRGWRSDWVVPLGKFWCSSWWCGIDTSTTHLSAVSDAPPWSHLVNPWSTYSQEQCRSVKRHAIQSFPYLTISLELACD